MRFTYDKKLEFLDCLYRPQRKRGNMEADERIVSISKHKEGFVATPKVPGKTRDTGLCELCWIWITYSYNQILELLGILDKRLIKAAITRTWRHCAFFTYLEKRVSTIGECTYILDILC